MAITMALTIMMDMANTMALTIMMDMANMMDMAISMAMANLMDMATTMAMTIMMGTVMIHMIFTNSILSSIRTLIKYILHMVLLLHMLLLLLVVLLLVVLLVVLLPVVLLVLRRQLKHLQLPHLHWPAENLINTILMTIRLEFAVMTHTVQFMTLSELACVWLLKKLVPKEEQDAYGKLNQSLELKNVFQKRSSSTSSCIISSNREARRILRSIYGMEQLVPEVTCHMVLGVQLSLVTEIQAHPQL